MKDISMNYFKVCDKVCSGKTRNYWVTMAGFWVHPEWISVTS